MPDNAPAAPVEHAEPPVQLDDHVRAYFAQIGRKGGLRGGGHKWTRKSSKQAIRKRWAGKKAAKAA